MPFNKIKGCELELIEVIPRIRITEPLPKSPEFATMSSPAIRPCKASSMEATDTPSIAFVLNFCMAPEYSRSGMAKPPPPTSLEAFTVTSFMTFWDSSFTSNLRLFPMGTVNFLYPTKEKFKELLGFLIFREKFPLKSVKAEE